MVQTQTSHSKPKPNPTLDREAAITQLKKPPTAPDAFLGCCQKKIFASSILPSVKASSFQNPGKKYNQPAETILHVPPSGIIPPTYILSF
ncbi:hypothetical protein M407DRAFT_243372 [Tulasnella calospora MUT 4182]|uniref:Uncharacterized protein n=1 Tax=Tulasnella calospora MUT 4182 TaxID=1051891 RepID=A0A0C3L0Y1_9AGAM|nr:hypothetical protein M407DRAFT_243372 [Tulasnella calospora MUT 4182]